MLRPLNLTPVYGLLGLLLLTAATSAAETQPGSELISEAASPLPEPIAPAASPLLETEPVSKRLFGVIPNYRADQFQAVYTPLTTEQKFAIAHSDSFDWPNYFLLIGYAVQSQMALGGFSHSGGIKTFGKFYTRSIGDQVIGAYVTEAILPTLFHEDPRFFRLGQGPIWYRAYNAVARIFITRKDDGSTGFYFSEFVGNAGVTALTTVYYPDSRSASQGLERFTMTLGNDAISNLLTEFWPDIKRRLPFHHKEQ